MARNVASAERTAGQEGSMLFTRSVPARDLPLEMASLVIVGEVLVERA